MIGGYLHQRFHYQSFIVRRSEISKFSSLLLRCKVAECGRLQALRWFCGCLPWRGLHCLCHGTCRGLETCGPYRCCSGNTVRICLHGPFQVSYWESWCWSRPDSSVYCASSRGETCFRLWMLWVYQAGEKQDSKLQNACWQLAFARFPTLTALPAPGPVLEEALQPIAVCS